MDDYQQNKNQNEKKSKENLELFKQAINEALYLKFSKSIAEAGDEDIEAPQANNKK